MRNKTSPLIKGEKGMAAQLQAVSGVDIVGSDDTFLNLFKSALEEEKGAKVTETMKTQIDAIIAVHLKPLLCPPPAVRIKSDTWINQNIRNVGNELG